MSAKPVDLRALEAAHQFTSVEHTQYTLISRGEFHALIAALRIAVEALKQARDQTSRGEWGSHSSGTWVILNDALAQIAALVTVEGATK